MKHTLLTKFVFILFFLSPTVFAERVAKIGEVLTFGSWTTTSSEFENAIMSFAKTTNKDGSTLGFLCSTSSSDCLPYLALKLGCEPGKTYPMLISLPEGVYAELLLCEFVSGIYIYNFPSQYTNSLVEANNVGFAYGTNNGEFKASYFSLDGSPKALIAAKKIIHAAEKNKTKEAPKPNPKSNPNEISL